MLNERYKNLIKCMLAHRKWSFIFFLMFSVFSKHFKNCMWYMCVCIAYMNTHLHACMWRSQVYAKAFLNHLQPHLFWGFSFNLEVLILTRLTGHQPLDVFLSLLPRFRITNTWDCIGLLNRSQRFKITS